jgi:hypothetical protein
VWPFGHSIMKSETVGSVYEAQSLEKCVDERNA